MYYETVTQVPTNIGLIDSLTVYLPIEKVTVIDKRLTDDYLAYYPNDDVLLEEIHPPKPIMIEYNGIKFRMNKIVFPPITSRGIVIKEGQTYIRLTLTSKMLMHRYFEGINLQNLPFIVQFINATDIIKFDIETLLDSITNDIDICINYILDFESYKLSLQYLYDKVKDSKKHAVELFPKRSTLKINKNIGIVYGNRDSGKYATPFCKFYNKENELLTNSAEFYNTYLFNVVRSGLSIKNLIRKEITIKNAQTLKYLTKVLSLPSDLKTLRDILTLETSQLTYICNSTLKWYYDKKQFHVKTDLSPTEKIISYYMHKLVELGADKNDLFFPLDFIDCKVQRSRSRSKIDELIKETFSDKYIQNKLEQNQKVNNFINLQNLWDLPQSG